MLEARSWFALHSRLEFSFWHSASFGYYNLWHYHVLFAGLLKKREDILQNTCVPSATFSKVSEEMRSHIYIVILGHYIDQTKAGGNT